MGRSKSSRWEGFHEYLWEIQESEGRPPGPREAARVFGVSHTTGQRWFAELEAAGLLRKEGGCVAVSPPARSARKLTDEERGAVESHLRLVYTAARGASPGRRCDSIQNGVVGLIDAVLRRDERRSAREFRAFARQRIAGEIMDGPDGPRDSVVPVPASSMREAEARGETAPVVTRIGHGWPLPSRSSYGLPGVTFARDLREILGKMGAQGRAIELCDLDGMTLKEAGDVIGVTLSRVSQLRAKGLETLASNPVVVEIADEVAREEWRRTRSGRVNRKPADDSEGWLDAYA